MSKITINVNPPVDEHEMFRKKLAEQGLPTLILKVQKNSRPWEEDPETVWLFCCEANIEKDKVVTLLDDFFKSQGGEGSCLIMETGEVIELG